MIRSLSTNRIQHSLRILGIETSCDDTAAAVVDSERRIISQACRNQLKYHQPWGGIVPSIAKNHHYENLVPVVAEVMKDIDWNVSHLIDKNRFQNKIKSTFEIDNIAMLNRFYLVLI
jgi:N6-L-threonylcarbamoyladenine synthase